MPCLPRTCGLEEPTSPLSHSVFYLSKIRFLEVHQGCSTWGPSSTTAWGIGMLQPWEKWTDSSHFEDHFHFHFDLRNFISTRPVFVFFSWLRAWDLWFQFKRDHTPKCEVGSWMQFSSSKVFTKISSKQWKPVTFSRVQLFSSFFLWCIKLYPMMSPYPSNCLSCF